MEKGVAGDDVLEVLTDDEGGRAKNPEQDGGELEDHNELERMGERLAESSPRVGDVCVNTTAVHLLKANLTLCCQIRCTAESFSPSRTRSPT
jgi:hypothetical protein